MRSRIAIIGGGPTALFAVQKLISSTSPLTVEIFEQFGQIGPGMPYREGLNDPRMLANIASREMPRLLTPFADWLRAQDEKFLAGFGIERANISEATCYPRLALGAYFTAQLAELVAQGRARGHLLDLAPHTRVMDVVPLEMGIEVRWQRKGEEGTSLHDHVVIATGHQWDAPDEPGPAMLSPWPAQKLRSLANSRIGILGSSLSAIDVAVAVGSASGAFATTPDGLEWRPGDHARDFSITMMSRNGLLPEADSYYPLPFEPLPSFTQSRAFEEARKGQAGLLDRLFAVFVADLGVLDPDYASQIDLPAQSCETFASAHFAERLKADPFVWAERNLAEARLLNQRKAVAPWRYAILRAHAVFESITAELSPADLARFHRHLKSVFTDNYASVPHRSIQRLLALHRAGRLAVERIEDHADFCRKRFDAIVDARGQQPRKLSEIPFPTLARLARFSTARGDEPFRLEFRVPITGTVQCVAIPYLLRRYPFVQGLVNAQELGETAARCIMEREARTESPAFSIPATQLRPVTASKRQKCNA